MGSILNVDRSIISIEDYLQNGGGEALAIAWNKGPRGVLEEIKNSRLRGRGGAGFPTGMKWESVQQHPCPTKYVVCNGADGEPGTYKDRWLIGRNPYQVLEGTAIAAFAVGAERAFIATKARFQSEIAALQRAASEMAEAGLLGPVPIEVIEGPDEYLFGEEKAMLAVIEGEGALPRIFPPYWVGLFAKAGSPNPTVMNNVETLANVPPIIQHGAGWFRSIGVEGCSGTMLFTLVGDVRAPGVYELPLGTTLGDLIYEIGGGPPAGREVKAIFPGASHGILTARQLDTPLDFDSMKKAGSGLGSAGFVVYDDSTCIVQATSVMSRFLFIESCAQCPPCKSGTKEITQCLERIHGGHGSQDDLDKLRSRCSSVTGGQICGLPTGESAIVQSALQAFEDEFRSHLRQSCPKPRDLNVPKLVDFDDETGTFTYDDSHRLKQPDWSYGPPGDHAEVLGDTAAKDLAT